MEISQQRVDDLLLSQSQFDSEKKSNLERFDDDERFSPIPLKNRTFFSKKEVSMFKMDDNVLEINTAQRFKTSRSQTQTSIHRNTKISRRIC